MDNKNVALQEQSLLVKTVPGRPAPYALENLRTGWRREFPSPPALLAALSRALEVVDSPEEGESR
jgi:hypothetical protein